MDKAQVSALEGQRVVTTAERIRELMDRRGIATPTELARQCGLPQPTLHRILKGKVASASLETLQVLANFFSVTVSQVLGEVALSNNDDPSLSRVLRVMEPMAPYKRSACADVLEAIATIAQPAPNEPPTRTHSPSPLYRSKKP
jgi:transcriptional regulator with XRE-family HTH domain